MAGKKEELLREKKQDRQDRSRLQDDLGIARCPLCEQPLVVRMGRHGPVFPCRCPVKEQKSA